MLSMLWSCFLLGSLVCLDHFTNRSRHLLCESTQRCSQRFCWDAKDKSLLLSDSLGKSYPSCLPVLRALFYQQALVTCLGQLNWAESENLPHSSPPSNRHITKPFKLFSNLHCFSISSQWRLYFLVGQAPNREIILIPFPKTHIPAAFCWPQEDKVHRCISISITYRYLPRLIHHLTSAHSCMSPFVLPSTC